MSSGSPKSECWALWKLHIKEIPKQNHETGFSPGTRQSPQRLTGKWQVHLSRKGVLKISKASKRHSKRNLALTISHYRVFQTSGKLRKNYNFQAFLVLKLSSQSYAILQARSSRNSCLVCLADSKFCCHFYSFPGGQPIHWSCFLPWVEIQYPTLQLQQPKPKQFWINYT